MAQDLFASPSGVLRLSIKTETSPSPRSTCRTGWAQVFAELRESCDTLSRRDCAPCHPVSCTARPDRPSPSTTTATATTTTGAPRSTRPSASYGSPAQTIATHRAVMKAIAAAAATSGTADALTPRDVAAAVPRVSCSARRWGGAAYSSPAQTIATHRAVMKTIAAAAAATGADALTPCDVAAAAAAMAPRHTQRTQHTAHSTPPQPTLATEAQTHDEEHEQDAEPSTAAAEEMRWPRQWAREVAALSDMGFELTPATLAELLERHRGVIAAVVADLLGARDA